MDNGRVGASRDVGCGVVAVAVGCAAAGCSAGGSTVFLALGCLGDVDDFDIADLRFVSPDRPADHEVLAKRFKDCFELQGYFQSEGSRKLGFAGVHYFGFSISGLRFTIGLCASAFS